MKRTDFLNKIMILAFLAIVAIPCYVYAEYEDLKKETEVLSKKTPQKAQRIIPMGSLQVLGAYSDSDRSNKGLWGYDISGYFSPTIRLDDTHYLIPLYNGTFKRIRQYVAQEEGGRLYNTVQTHNASLAFRSQPTDDLLSRATIFGTWNYVTETRDESFGKGLYDYRDYGASLDLHYNIITLDRERKIGYIGGLEYFHREYPNFKSLISLSTNTAAETNEKDFDGIKISTGLDEITREGLNWEFKPYLLLKYFIDKKTIGEDGVLDTSKKRKDYVLSFPLNLKYPFAAGRWEIALDNSVDYNHSNLGFYDSRDTTTLADDVFTQHYFNYLSYLTNPYITYYYHFSRDKKMFVRLGYSFMRTDYSDRKAQQADGTYTGSEQTDKESAFHVVTSYPITKSISWLTTFDYTRETSNQKYEKYYTYSYDTYQIQSGISMEF